MIEKSTTIYIAFFIIITSLGLILPHRHKKVFFTSFCCIIFGLLIKNIIEGYIECVHVDVIIRTIIVLLVVLIVNLVMYKKTFLKVGIFLVCVLFIWTILLKTDVIKIYQYTLAKTNENMHRIFINHKNPECNTFIIRLLE